MEKYITDVKTIKGSRTRENLDKFFISSFKDAINVSLCDGASSSKNSSIAATILSREMNEYIGNNFDLIFNETSISRMQRLLAVKIDFIMEKISEDYLVERKDLGSTLSHLSIKNGKYLIVNIGDGMVLGKKSKENSILARPLSGMIKNSTYLCSQDNLNRYINVVKGDAFAYKIFYLLTDGWYDNLIDLSDLDKFKKCTTDDDKTLISIRKERR